MTHTGQTGVVIDHDGERLLGTLFLAAGENPKPTALILHGIPGIEKNVDLGHSLRANGANALLFHYRGCWGSSGRYNVHTIPADVAGAFELVRSGRFPQVDPDRVFLIGHSLGGWAAVLAAAADDRIRAAAAIAAVTDPADFPLSEPDYAAGYTPWLTGISPVELAEQWRSLGPDLTPLEQVARIAPRPLLIVHSRADEEVSVEHSRRLSERAGAGSRYIETADGNHAFSWRRLWLQEILLDWVREIGLLAERPER